MPVNGALFGILREAKNLPIYEYECNCCSTRFDLRRSFSDDSQVLCPRCEGETERIFSPVPIIFKGSGFYVTDSRNSSNPASDPASPASSESSSNEAKADSSEKSSSNEPNADSPEKND